MRIPRPQVVGPRARSASSRWWCAAPRRGRRAAACSCARRDVNPERLILDDELARVPAANVGDRLRGTLRAVVTTRSATTSTCAAAPRRVDRHLRRERTARAGARARRRLDERREPQRRRSGEQVPAAGADRRAQPALARHPRRGGDAGRRRRAGRGPARGRGRRSAASSARSGRRAGRATGSGRSTRGRAPTAASRAATSASASCSGPTAGCASWTAPGGDATTPTREDRSRRGAQLTLSPGRVQPRNPAFRDSRKPLAGEFRVGAAHGCSWSPSTSTPRAATSRCSGASSRPRRASETQRHAQARVGARLRAQPAARPTGARAWSCSATSTTSTSRGRCAIVERAAWRT